MSTKKAPKKPAALKGTKTAKARKAAPAKKARTKPAANGKATKLSAIDAAAQVLASSTEPMNAKQMIEAMADRGLWTSPGGKTPWATLYSAIMRRDACGPASRGSAGRIAAGPRFRSI